MMIKKFIMFLKRHGVYAKYRYYTLNECMIDEPFFLPPLMDCNEWIIAPFNWNRTKEGTRFWANLHEEWREFINGR